MAVVFLVDDDRRRKIPISRLLRERIVLEHIRNEVSRYRLSRDGIERLLVLIGDDIAPTCRRAHAINPVTQARLEINELFEDLCDGKILMELLNIVSGENLGKPNRGILRVQKAENINTCLSFLRTKVCFENISAEDIIDGKPTLILGLIWTIILRFEIGKIQIEKGKDTESGEKRSANDVLLLWCQKKTAGYSGVNITDFTNSWRDGLGFNALIHAHRPDLIEYEMLVPTDHMGNLNNAFNFAENALGIPKILETEDIDVEMPDEKSIITYVASYYHYFTKMKSEITEDKVTAKLRENTKRGYAEQEMADYKELENWCRTEAEEVLKIIDRPVADVHQEYMEYVAFKAEVDRRGHIYNKLYEKVRTGNSVRFKPETFKSLEEAWTRVVRQTRIWLWILDASLPEKLGKFGDWLYQAEENLELEEEFIQNPNEMAMQLDKKIQDHMTFFKELEPQETFVQQVRCAGKYEGTQIPTQQMDNFRQRLTRVCTMAPQRERRLEYEEMKYQLLAFLLASENKLKIWTVKYGHQPQVEALLADYKNFVQSGNLFKNYDQTHETCKRIADAYRETKDDKTEIEQINGYFDEVNGRWKKVSVEIKSVQSMLEKVIDCWRKYNARVDELAVWLNDGERVMSRSSDEKQTFFVDLAQNEEKHKILNEFGNFLIETTEEPVASEIKQTLLMVNRRFKDLVESFQHFKKVEELGKARYDYNDGLLKVTQWIKVAEELITREVPCEHAVLRDYLNDLETLENQILSIENDFETTTKTTQSLVTECSQDVVNDMLQSLNTQKEAIVRLRKEIPAKAKHILPQIECLENSCIDLKGQLSLEETLLESHKRDETQKETEQGLEKHKQMNLLVPIKLEFAVQEKQFLGLVENAEITINQLQQGRENVTQTMQKQEMFYQGNFHKTCVKCLEAMDGQSRKLLQHDPRDNSVRDQYGKHLDRWNKLKEAIDATLLSLQHLTERWKDYHMKLGDFANFVETMEEMQTQLQRADQTSEEYENLHAKYERSIVTIEKFAKHSKWLQSNLEELLADSDDTDKKNERNRLGGMMTRFNNLLPNTQKDAKQVFRVLEGIRNQRRVNKWTSMLDDLLKQMLDKENQPFIDGLDEAKSLLKEHEDKMSKLDSLKANVADEILLQQERNAQTCISQGFLVFYAKLKDACIIDKTSRAKLKKAVTDWKTYEDRITKGYQTVDDVKKELKQQPTEEFTKNVILAKRDQLQQNITTLKANLSEVQRLNNILRADASEARVEYLKKQLKDFQYRIDTLSLHLNYRVSELEESNKRQ